MAIAAPDDAECTATIRMLDIISETYDALRIMGKLAQLSRHKDQKVRSKAILLMGRRNKNHKWVSGFLSEVDPRTRANAIESLYATVLVMTSAIINEKLRREAPDLLVQPNVGTFRTLDFFQASAILRVAEAAKADLKAKLEALLG